MPEPNGEWYRNELRSAKDSLGAAYKRGERLEAELRDAQAVIAAKDAKIARLESANAGLVALLREAAPRLCGIGSWEEAQALAARIEQALKEAGVRDV